MSKWFPDKKHVGIENHLNYIYRYLGELNETEVWGLSGLLNSTLFDTYFQTFNGNTNVSVTELKEMRFPSYETIEKLGLILKKKKAEELTQEFLDRTVRRLLNIQIS